MTIKSILDTLARVSTKQEQFADDFARHRERVAIQVAEHEARVASEMAEHRARVAADMAAFHSLLRDWTDRFEEREIKREKRINEITENIDKLFKIVVARGNGHTPPAQ